MYTSAPWNSGPTRHVALGNYVGDFARYAGHFVVATLPEFYDGVVAAHGFRRAQ